MPTRTTPCLIAALILGVLLATAPAPAIAWGDLGHKIVCELALHELNAKASAEVARLINKDPQFKAKGFPDACTWPDHPRKRDTEHFINAPRDLSSLTSETCPVAAACLFTAIAADLKILKTSTNDAAKLASLKFLGHWLGDIHQPLHVSFEDDRGGNKILGVGSCTNNLHSIWDSCIIEQRLGTNASDVARDLAEGITLAERTTWQATPIKDWANESFAIARRPSAAYCVIAGTKCVYETGNESFDPGEQEKTVTVDGPYLDTHGPLLAERLQRAGVRLGHLLNESLGK